MAKQKIKNVAPAPSGTGVPSVMKVKHKTPKGGDVQDTIARWWLSEESDVFRHVAAVLNTIDSRQMSRRFSNVRWLKMYSNYDSVGLTGGIFSRMMPAGSYASKSYRFTLNVVESCIDAAAAKIAKSTPLPKILTSKGNFMQQKRAKLLNSYIEGMIDQLKIYEKAQQVFVDSAIWGTGALKIFIEDGQIRAKRVLIDDLIVDEEDGRDGDPRQMHQRDHINRDVLSELFPEHAEKIKYASSVLPGEKYTPISQDLVAVTESWHLPSAFGAGDGRHVICTDNCTLFSEEWDKDWFPFAFLRWKPRPIGFYGMGLAEQLGPIQVEINKICILIQESIQRMAKPNVFVPNGSNIIATQISDVIGAIIKTNGPIPTIMTPQAQSPEVYQWLENLYKKAYEVTGISQLSAQSQKPAGLNSGAALREFQDIETARFELTGQRYEQFFVEFTRILLSMSRDLYASGTKKLGVKVKGRKFIEQINWKDAELEENEFVMDIFPESSLPSTPAGRLATVTELTQAGYISKERSLELLDFPDLEEFVSVQLAALEDAKMTVDQIRWEGKWSQPTPLMNLQTCVDLAHSAYLNAKGMDTPPEHLEMLINFISECQELMNPAPDDSAPPPEEPLLDEAVPGKPIAPPTAELMPPGS